MPADTVFSGFRVSFFCQQIGDRTAGWSENFWCSLTDRSQALVAAQNLAQALNFAKGSQTWVPRFRMSIPGVFRSGKTYIRSGAAPASTAYPSDYPVTKWLLQMVGNAVTTQQWFGGVLDSSVISGGVLDQAQVLAAGFARVRTQLLNQANGWQINALNPGTLPIPILSVDPATGTVTTGGHTYITGNRVRIQFVRGLTYANRIWRVIQIAGNTTQFVLAGWAPQTTPFLASPSASARQQNYLGQTIVQVNPVRSSNHRVGRPTGLFGGRPKKKRTA